MAALLGPDFIALQVSDLAASKAFYVEVLGLVEQIQSPPGAIVFDTRPIPFAIREPLVDLQATDKLGWGVSLWIASDDADGLHDALVAAGAAITQPPFDGPFGRQFGFVDPDGYGIVVHQDR